MNGFFKALSELFESDLVKSYGWVIFVSFVIIVVISWVIMGFIFLKIIVPSKLIEANNIKRLNEDLSKKVEELTKQIDVLKENNNKLEEKLQHFRFQEALEGNEETIVRRQSFNQFTQ